MPSASIMPFSKLNEDNGRRVLERQWHTAHVFCFPLSSPFPWTLSVSTLLRSSGGVGQLGLAMLDEAGWSDRNETWAKRQGSKQKQKPKRERKEKRRCRRKVERNDGRTATRLSGSFGVFGMASLFTTFSFCGQHLAGIKQHILSFPATQALSSRDLVTKSVSISHYYNWA